MVQVVTDETFEQEVVQSDIPCVLDFHAQWCQPCKDLAPVFGELSAEYEGRVKFCSIDSEANRALRIRFAVAVLPFIVWTCDGTKTALFDQSVPKEKLRERIDYMLAGREAPSFKL